jgi:hypothetical protein
VSLLRVDETEDMLIKFRIHSRMSPPSKPQDYHVGWIGTVQTEYVAACKFLDEEHLDTLKSMNNLAMALRDQAKVRADGRDASASTRAERDGTGQKSILTQLGSMNNMATDA